MVNPDVPHDDKEASLCPFCRDLPEYAITNGMEGPPIDIQINVESETIPEDVARYSNCTLYLVINCLRRIWSGTDQFPTAPRLTGDNIEKTCIKGVSLLTDPTTPIDYLDIFTPASSRLPPIHRDPCSPLAIARIQRWIANCDKRHRGCGVNQCPLLPTRVLDVGSGNSAQVVKLVETTKEQRGAYIALSHCWGKSNPFITTRDNFKQMQNGFLSDIAPATFRDAIEFSRKLGIRYLWIDSLCIVQGDKKDWETQASRMARVYRDATLTLSASSASADSKGFLKHRPSRHSTINITSSSGQSVEVYLSERFANRAVTGDPEYNVIQPLDTRGWCLQECFLSNRQIKFLNTKILWSCQNVDLDEGYQDNLNGAMGIQGTHQNVMYLFRNVQKARHRTLTLTTPYSSWYNMITEFTKRSLTFASDVLPALSGLAYEVAVHDNGKYCAGVWWEDIAFGICWKKSATLKLAAGPNEYIAPSWSWASVVGPVEFVNKNDVMYRQTPITVPIQVSFHDFWIQNHGSNLYGQIDDACIKLEAPFISLEETDEDTFCIPHMVSLGGRIEVTFDLEEDKQREKLSALFLLRRLPYSSTPNIEEVMLFGLIICPVSRSSQKYGHLEVQIHTKVYRRVGFVQIWTSFDKETEYWQIPRKVVVLI